MAGWWGQKCVIDKNTESRISGNITLDASIRSCCELRSQLIQNSRKKFLVRISLHALLTYVSHQYAFHSFAAVVHHWINFVSSWIHHGISDELSLLLIVSSFLSWWRQERDFKVHRERTNEQHDAFLVVLWTVLDVLDVAFMSYRHPIYIKMFISISILRWRRLVIMTEDSRLLELRRRWDTTRLLLYSHTFSFGRRWEHRLYATFPVAFRALLKSCLVQDSSLWNGGTLCWLCNIDDTYDPDTTAFFTTHRNDANAKGGRFPCCVFHCSPLRLVSHACALH